MIEKKIEEIWLRFSLYRGDAPPDISAWEAESVPFDIKMFGIIMKNAPITMEDIPDSPPIEVGETFKAIMNAGGAIALTSEYTYIREIYKYLVGEFKEEPFYSDDWLTVLEQRLIGFRYESKDFEDKWWSYND